MIMPAKPNPLQILLNDYLPAPEAAAVEAQVSNIQELPAGVPLGDLRTPVYGNDPNELLKHRFLYRGAIALLLGPTGIGKSSLGTQLAMHWSVGRELFGIVPGEIYQREGMRILIVQAENDEGDLAEMRDGVLAGCDALSEEEKQRACRNIRVATVTDKSGPAFAATLEALLVEHGPLDLVIVDPAFAYLGGDSNSQKDVSFFMRELLNALLHKHRVGMVLVHHTNKPLRGKEKDSWAAGDFAYLGAGSAEWINPARSALAIRSIGSESVFEFRGAKRGKRLRWVDADGTPTVVRHIAHHGAPGVICWREADPDEVAELLEDNKGGRPRKCDLIEVLHCLHAREKRNQGYYKTVISERLGCSENAVQNAIASGVANGLIRFVEQGREKHYSLSGKGQKTVAKTPGAIDWRNQQPETL